MIVFDLKLVREDADGIVLGLAACGRAEHVEMFNAKPLQVGFVLLQSAYGFVSFHKANIASWGLRSGRRYLSGTPGRRLLRRWKEQIGRHTETGAQTLHHRHTKPLFATHDFTDAAWRAEQRDEVSSRQAVLIHKVADQFGDARRPTGPFHFLVRGNQPRLRLQRLDRSSSIAGRRAPERAIARHRYQSG